MSLNRWRAANEIKGLEDERSKLVMMRDSVRQRSDYEIQLWSTGEYGSKEHTMYGDEQIPGLNMTLKEAMASILTEQIRQTKVKLARRCKVLLAP